MTGFRRSSALAVLEGKPMRNYPCFSGLVNVTVSGLEAVGLTLSEVHGDASKMASAAATTPRAFGFASAIVPLDICVEAEALGARVDFGAPGQSRLPQVVGPIVDSVTHLALDVPADVTRTGRIPTVLEAIGILKRDIGSEVAVGAWMPGPFTVATLIVELPTLLTEIRTERDGVASLLDLLTDFLTRIGRAYVDAGADFLTVHEMGGSPGFIGPEPFEALVLPRLKDLLAALPSPRVLSICGRTEHALDLLTSAGAEAISVDQSTDLVRARERLGPRVRLFGNIDPVGVLASGRSDDVRSAVAAAIEAGVDAVWPGCDLLPDLPEDNLLAMVEAAGSHERST